MNGKNRLITIHSLHGITVLTLVVFVFGCSTPPVWLTPHMHQHAHASSKELEVRISGLLLSANAVNISLFLKNMSVESIVVTQKDMYLVDGNGRRVTPTSGPPPENLYEVAPPGLRDRNWGAIDVVTFPLALAGGLIALPITLPLSLCCPEIFGWERSPLWPHPSWEATYNPDAVVADVAPGSDRVVWVHFDRKKVDVDTLSAISITNPLTNETIEASLKTYRR